MSNSEDNKSSVKAKKPDAPVKSIWKKKGKQEEESLLAARVSVNDSEGEEATRKKERKNKKKSEKQDDHLEVGTTRVKEPNGSDKNRKKRKRNIQDDVVEIEANPRPKKKSPRVRPQRETSPTETINEQSDEATIQKKRQKEQKTSSGSQPGETIEKKRKKQKNKTDFPDPEDGDDKANLTDQSRKALSYALSKFHKPHLWKFQKARQNWLIRNFWSTNSIPEKYEDLVIRYLSTTQGNSRDNLIKTCRTIIDNTQTTLNENIKPPESTAPSNLGGALIDVTSPFNPPKDDRKKTRAQALLGVLELDMS